MNRPIPTPTLRALMPERTLTITLEGAACTRIRAYMDRVERAAPGMAYGPGESDVVSLCISVGALLDRGLTEGENDDGLRYDWSTDRLVAAPRLGRFRRALRELRFAS